MVTENTAELLLRTWSRWVRSSGEVERSLGYPQNLVSKLMTLGVYIQTPITPCPHHNQNAQFVEDLLSKLKRQGHTRLVDAAIAHYVLPHYYDTVARAEFSGMKLSTYKVTVRQLKAFVWGACVMGNTAQSDSGAT